MQKHNKYLVWTIWVATIAFIGAGFVGWGSYSFGSKAGNIAKVGNIEIKQSQLNMAYSNLYNQYNQMMQGKLDEKKAKEMGLVQQAFSRIEVQAKLLNFAQEMGIVVSDKEVADTLAGIKGFQKGGVFNKDIYNTYLKSQRLKAKTFEATLKDEITIQKTLALLHTDALPLEEETVSSAMNVADRLMYRVLKSDDVNLSMDEAKIKAFWETQKENFMTPRIYKLSIVWTETDSVEVTDKEIKAFYDENSFNYTDAAGKQLLFDKAKSQAAKDLKIKKSKKAAQKQYIAFKKGKLKTPAQSVALPANDPSLSKDLWEAVLEKNKGDIVKPKVVGDKYATVKIEAVIEPKVETFEEAKEEVAKRYKLQAQKEALQKLAEKALETLDDNNAIVSDYVTLEKNENLKSSNIRESLQFLQKLFTSLKEKGIISIADKVVVYKILDQKFLPADQNRTNFVKQTVNQMKHRTFEANLIKLLDTKYPTETYMGGLKN